MSASTFAVPSAAPVRRERHRVDAIDQRCAQARGAGLTGLRNGDLRTRSRARRLAPGGVRRCRGNSVDSGSRMRASAPRHHPARDRLLPQARGSRRSALRASSRRGPANRAGSIHLHDHARKRSAAPRGSSSHRMSSPDGNLLDRDVQPVGLDRRAGIPVCARYDAADSERPSARRVGADSCLAARTALPTRGRRLGRPIGLVRVHQ